jgi:hypothetical protein
MVWPATLIPTLGSGCAAIYVGTLLDLSISAGQNMPSKLYEGFNLYSFHRNLFNVKAEGISQGLNNVKSGYQPNPIFLSFFNENVAHLWVNKYTFKIQVDSKPLSRTVREC